MAAAAAASVTGAGETTAAAMSGLPAAPAESIDLTAIGWDEQSMNEVVEDIENCYAWIFGYFNRGTTSCQCLAAWSAGGGGGVDGHRARVEE
eukprot:COSAG01_NODE_13300_length_1604_cov_10.776080_1_plen_92_part_00